MKYKWYHCLAIAFSLLFALMLPDAFAGSEQETVAQNFLKFLRSDKAIQSAQILERNSLDSSAQPIPIAHVFKLTGGGYIIVAPSKDLTPIKAYSLTNDFAALPPAYRTALLDELEAHVRSMQVAAERTTQSDGASENRLRWDFLLKLDESRLPLTYTPDTFLLSTTWNQSAPYNKFLPEVSGQKTITGCVNTAIGQIMKYHGYPSEGRGVVSYTWNEQPLKAVLYRPYNWANMPSKLVPDTPEYQTDEVARFMRDIGIANHTNYGLDSSSTGLNRVALIENYGYSNTIQRMYNTDVNAFFATLKSEIDAGRPVYLSFPGHATVADGYASDGAGRKIHVNMGWQGSYDNYYYLDQTVVAGSYSFSTSPENLDIYFNIKPCSGADCAHNQESADVISGLNISGDFNYANDVDLYTVYLKGSTTLTASRGYSSIAFKMTLYDASGNEAWTFDGSEDHTPVVHSKSLPEGKYTLEVSLGGYTYSETYKHYTITLTTESITPEERTAFDAAADIPPVINTLFRDTVLSSSEVAPAKFLVDARDENGDAVTLQVKNSNPSAVTAALSNNILEITPVTGAAKIAAKITVKATANSKTAEKSFVVLVSNEDVGFGKTFEVKGLFENQSDFNQH
ncbi:MAG: C10 family peptidase, partial [Deltaproteobacteria bacterium]|nr:C10 family peptidase [Deltaproteobacteria bacterium]